jgi:CHASE3 domain sensor protein
MAREERFVWGMAASVLAVMVLVFAALVSSWLGLNAEARGRAAVAQAAQLERDVAEARALAATIATLQSEIALEALRGERLGEDNERVGSYGRTLEALRARLARLAAAPLEQEDRELLQAAQEAIDHFVAIHAAAAPKLRTESRVAKLQAVGSLLDGARPVADGAVARIRVLEPRRPPRTPTPLRSARGCCWWCSAAARCCSRCCSRAR